jgi:hypothetical protein
MKILKISDEERCVSSCREAGQHSPRRKGRPKITGPSKGKPEPKRIEEAAFAEDFYLGHSVSNAAGTRRDTIGSKTCNRYDQVSLSCVYLG